MGRRHFWQRLLIILTFVSALGGLLSCGQAESGPKAWIDSPREGTSLQLGSPVTIISHAYAREGVAEVMLSVDGQPYRRDGPPEPGASFIRLAQEWRPDKEGIYTLQVTTYAADGTASNPATVSISVVGVVAQASGPVADSPTPTWTPIIPGPITPTITPTPTWTPIIPGPITPTPLTPTPITPMPITPTPITPTPVTPVPEQPDLRFWPDSDQVQAGACTRVNWHVANVNAYWVDGQAGAGNDGGFQTCPCADETHTLRAVARDGSEQNLSITIRVSGQCVTPPPPQSVAVPSPNTPRDDSELDCRSSQDLIWVPIEAPGGSARYYVKQEQRVGDQWQSLRGWGPESGKQVTASVECGATYRWAVRAEDGSGNLSEWSSWSRFSIAAQAPPPQPQPVPVPSPAVPQNGSEFGCRATQTLVWVPIEAPGGSARYYIKLERNEDNQWRSFHGWGPESGKQVEASVECGYLYRWAVRADDGSGNFGEWSSWSAFTVTLN